MGGIDEFDLETRRLRLLTSDSWHHTYTRDLYLTTGDVLLPRPERFDLERPGDARVQCIRSVVDKGGTKRRYHLPAGAPEFTISGDHGGA